VQEAIMVRSALGLILSLACAAAQAANYSDIWWNPAESGWGITLADHESNLFGVWYTYRADGKPVWYTIPGGTFSSDRRTFTGDVYLAHGSSYTLATFDSSQVGATKVGTATFDFAPANQPAGSATFSYNVNGVSKSSHIERQSFGNAAPQWGSDFTDLWFNPAEAGWGVSLAQHGNNVFGVWYAYDTDGQPLWFVLPGVQFTSSTAFSGTLYTTTGPYYGNPTFDASAVKATEAGSATFNMNLGASATAQCDSGAATFAPVVTLPGGTAPYQRAACAQPFGHTRASTQQTASAQPKRCGGSYAGASTAPGSCPDSGALHAFNGTITIDGVDWSRTGHQSASVSVSNYLLGLVSSGGDSYGYYGSGSTACDNVLSPLSIPNVDVNLASGSSGMSASGTLGIGGGATWSYDLTVAGGAVTGHVRYFHPSDMSVYYSDFEAKASFSCAVQ
jgi:hypothetical protein